MVLLSDQECKTKCTLQIHYHEFSEGKNLVVMLLITVNPLPYFLISTLGAY